MHRFFPDFDSLDRFTLSLRCLDDKLRCPHCAKSHHLVSHGVVYKQRSMTEREAVGKRVLCSNRYQHKGCGRTLRLYVATVVPTLRYAVATVFAFVSALLLNASVCAAYHAATGQSEARHAWRWLHALHQRLSDFRTFVHTHGAPLRSAFDTRCRRLQLLLPTLHALCSLHATAPCAHFQLVNQQPLL
jgi:hypothetical protein